MSKKLGTDQFIEIAKASARIRNIVANTPLRLSKSLSNNDTYVYFKMENLTDYIHIRVSKFEKNRVSSSYTYLLSDYTFAK